MSKVSEITFKEWEDTVESEYTCEFGRDWTRDIYPTPSGIKIYHEVCLPWNPFRQQTERAMVDVILPESLESWLRERHGAGFDRDRYTEEGFGYPVFSGEDCLEKAYNFIPKVAGHVIEVA